MATLHERAVKSATRRVDELGRLFARIGTSDHPQGQILSAYRTARDALQGNLSNPRAVEDALGTLRLAVERATSEILADAADLGLSQAQAELAIYGLPITGVGAQTSEALQAVVNVLEAQVQAVRALGLTGADEALAIGDASRVGMLSPGAVTREASQWTALTAEKAYQEIIDSSLGRAGAQDEYLRQAIAAVDQNTTETCLMINGHVAEVNGDFVLKGTPRFADKVHSTPFHWW